MASAQPMTERVRQFRDPPTAESDAPVATVEEGDSGNQNREDELGLVFWVSCLDSRPRSLDTPFGLDRSRSDLPYPSES